MSNLIAKSVVSLLLLTTGPALVAGVAAAQSTDDIVWQHRSGQVHFWPMKNGQRVAGIDIATPVGREWRLAWRRQR